jgi:small subunit ribosomal protein S9
MALARVMCEVNAENRLILKPEGLLTRDQEWLNVKIRSEEARRNFNSQKR